MPLRPSVSGSPVFCNAASISDTVAVGLADFSTAHAPATCGVAIEVPLNGVYPPGTDDVTPTPGASKLRKLALLENPATTFCLLVAPTLIAFETHAGVEIASAREALPEAMTVAIFALRRFGIIFTYHGSCLT